MTDLSVYFSDNYTASKYAFDTTRKSGHVAEAIKHEATLVAPDTPFDPTRVHFTQYVNDALRMRLESEGRWPPPAPKK